MHDRTTGWSGRVITASTCALVLPRTTDRPEQRGRLVSPWST